MNEEIKTMTVKEFREKGYLQELNRRFLHPLGLALSVKIHEDGTESFGEIWDYRDDEEGLIFGEDLVSKPSFQQKAKFVEGELNKKQKVRKNY